MYRLFGFYLSIIFSMDSIAADTYSKEQLLNNPQSGCRQVFFSDVEPIQKDCTDCLNEIDSLSDQREQDELSEILSKKNCALKILSIKEKERSGWSVYLDQDVLTLDSWTGLNDDRNYTMGLGGSLQGAAYSKGYIATMRNFLDESFNFHKDDHQLVERIHTLDFGVTAFTPDDLEQIEPIPGDRPYASLLYVSNSKLTANEGGTATKTNLSIGVLGLDIAKAVQRYLHNQVGISNQDPLGWDNQISEGGEITALYSYEKMSSLMRKSNVDIAYSGGINTGYYTDGYLGGDIRLGRITSPYYSFNANPMSQYNHKRCRFCRLKENYGFVSYKLRFVAYNALLQGQFRDSRVKIGSSDIEPILHEISVGWTYSVNYNWKATYALHYKSKEYKGTESRDHWFGGLYLSRNY